MQIETELDRLTVALETYLGAQWAEGVEVRALEAMADGHAGLTYGFEASRAGEPSDGFVLKLGPQGVRRSGSTDIYRQAPLLRALAAAGYPAPPTPWACSDDGPLGAPFIIMRRLPGRTFIIWDPTPALLRKPQQLPGMWLDTARAMGRLHRVDWRPDLSTWEAPVTLKGELDRWSSLLRHTEDGHWLELALALHEGLRRSMPRGRGFGLVHGDFQPGNVLFEAGALTGVIDWDLACIGPQGIDVGWLLMMADTEGWAENWKPHAPPPRSDLLDAYWRAGGGERAHLGWFQAFSQFRLAAIAGLNLKLHRSGRRRDPTWEKFVPSIPVLLRRGRDLL